MTPRLDHRKSTKGCLRCKRRKVKCDETHPECWRCLRHGVSCEYGPVEPRTAFASPASVVSSELQPTLSTSNTNNLPLLYSNFADVQITDLRLMHHYVTETACTLTCAHTPAVQRMWEVEVPQMAFEEPGLLHALLALAAAHLAVLRADEASRLCLIRQIHIDLAIQRHLAAVTSIDERNAPVSDIVCISTILISLYTLTLRSELDPTYPYEPPMQWLTLTRGIRTILQQTYWQLIGSKSRIQPLLRASAKILPQECQSEGKGGGIFGFLLECHLEDGDLDPEPLTAYSACILRLESMYAAVQGGESEFFIRQQFTTLIPAVPICFMQLLTEKRPRALVILAYHFALVKNAENVWWLKGIPEREVRGIGSIMPEKWKWAMEWPLDLTNEPVNAACPRQIPMLAAVPGLRPVPLS